MSDTKKSKHRLLKVRNLNEEPMDATIDDRTGCIVWQA